MVVFAITETEGIASKEHTKRSMRTLISIKQDCLESVLGLIISSKLERKENHFSFRLNYFSAPPSSCAENS